MNSRIKTLRKELKKTQEEFSLNIGLSRNFIAQIEAGTKIPSDRTIADICRVYSVNKKWLLEGTGEMFVSRTRNQIITDFAGDLINEPESFKKRFIEGLAKLDVSDWEEIERIVLKITNKESKGIPSR